MVENLKTTKYSDGSLILHASDSSIWGVLKTPGYCWYNNDIKNKEKYGALYNWYAINTGKLAPEGWHVPTGDDWETLDNYYRATYGDMQAKSLASITDWIYSSKEYAVGNNPSTNNKSGFTGYPGGYRSYSGSFEDKNIRGNWWSTKKHIVSEAWAYELLNSWQFLYKDYYNMQNGFSVRLIRD